MDEDELRMLCLAAESGLSGWEIDFIEDMNKRRGRELTSR